MSDEKLLKVAEVAERLNVGKSTVYKIIRDGELPHTRIGSDGTGPIRVRPKDLERFINRPPERPRGSLFDDDLERL
jgi:excisionase family DNA binding protein